MRYSVQDSSAQLFVNLSRLQKIYKSKVKDDCHFARNLESKQEQIPWIMLDARTKRPERKQCPRLRNPHRHSVRPRDYAVVHGYAGSLRIRKIHRASSAAAIERRMRSFSPRPRFGGCCNVGRYRNYLTFAGGGHLEVIAVARTSRSVPVCRTLTCDVRSLRRKFDLCFCAASQDSCE